MPSRKILIDTDCGVDDAEALVLALSNPDIVEVVGVTCVAGNAGLDNVVCNVLRVLKIMGRTDIPVFRGCSKPVNGALGSIRASGYHGADGLGGFAHTINIDGLSCQKTHGAQAICDIAKRHEGELEMVTLGPLTNVAIASRLDEQLFDRFRKVWVMGGNVHAHGNCAAGVTTEFNFGADPEAAATVLSECRNITVIPWETCYQNLVTKEFTKKWKAKMASSNSIKANFYRQLSEFALTVRTHASKVGRYYACDLWAMACVIDSNVAKTVEKYFCGVELQGRHTRGQLVIERRSQQRSDDLGEVEIVTDIDIPQMERLLDAMF